MATQPHSVVQEAAKWCQPSISDAETRWTQLQDAELCQEVLEYRSHIKKLCGRLGVQVDKTDLEKVPEKDQQPSKPQHEYSQYGEEGVDFSFGSAEDLDPSEWRIPEHSVPIHANVTTYDWSRLYGHTQFDVIMMDPPWQLATANPTRGVALGYSQLTDNDIMNLPVPKLQQNGFLFVWVINAKYKWTLDLFEKWGYQLVDEVVWVKMTVNRRLAKSHGYYLQHAKEVCLVGKRGTDPPGLRAGMGSDIIFSERRGQSQKPEEIYELVEQLVPNGRYLEIFARKNNLRNFWVSVGNEVTGTGLPEEDMAAVKENLAIPGAVYGKTGKN